jgi:hypothetical protein
MGAQWEIPWASVKGNEVLTLNGLTQRDNVPPENNTRYTPTGVRFMKRVFILFANHAILIF